MEESPKKMRFSLQKPSSNPDQVPLFSSKPNRPSSPTNYSSDQLMIMTSSHQIKSDKHNNHVGDLVMMREQKDQCSGGDRMKRHREEVAGRVVVPDRWGKEELMKDWIDYSSFDKVLVPSGVRSAREALVMEAPRRQATGSSSPASQRLRMERRCY
ncbi:hypothetical protein L484_022338 [Morus notabilis]|uniref:Protein BIC1 n=1 Tax=Morus notabilis TaxID=981085 RepID=W9QU41_9ROSA|nr:protein BIC2 [Morus notabilis]EXB38438.1 hypothetical protein L484_022338 [Morus notabilis]